MAIGVCGIMGQSSQGKRILIDAGRRLQHCLDKIAASDVMNNVGEKMRTKRVVTHVLNDRTATSVGMGFFQIIRGGTRKSLAEPLDEDFVPNRINDAFVGQYRIGMEPRNP